jgi:hypothetical protein
MPYSSNLLVSMDPVFFILFLDLEHAYSITEKLEEADRKN